MNEATPKTLLIFVDGVGIGGSNPEKNPLSSGKYPTLASILDEAKPIDACLDVPGVPQSATGQAALLTGVNASKQLGRHIEGFPPPSLKKVIEENNVFKALSKRGYQATFANAYYIDELSDLQNYKRFSVTTVTTLSGLGSVRMKEALLAGEAVYHDLTREALRVRGYEGPTILPEQAAQDLICIAQQNDFTLFEFFQTDIAGHRGSAEEQHEVLHKLDLFLSKVFAFLDEENTLLIITSDHGNIEDISHRSHTQNPVPFYVKGYKDEALMTSVCALTDVVPSLLELYPSNRMAE